MNNYRPALKYAIFLALVLALAGAAVAVEHQPRIATPELADQTPVIDTTCVGDCTAPVATVNGTAISRAELLLAERVISKEAPTSTPAEIEQRALHNVVTNEVLVQRAPAEGWNMSDSEIKDYITSVIAMARAEGATPLPMQMLDDAARQLGITVEQLPDSPAALNLYRRQFQIAFMRQRIAALLPVDERSTQAALDQAVDEYVRNSGAAVRTFASMMQLP
jgi:hypothetical protein